MIYTYKYAAAGDSQTALPSEDYLNMLGADGWQAVGLVSRPGVPGTVLLMRSVQTPASATPSAKGPVKGARR